MLLQERPTPANSHESQRNQESLLPYCTDIANTLRDYHYAIVGGLPIDAFNHPHSVIDAAAQTITIGPDFFTPLIRPNGTVRDYDIFVFGAKSSTDPQASITKDDQVHLKQIIATAMAHRAENNKQPTPAISLFSFDSTTSLFHSTTMRKNNRTMLTYGFTRQRLPSNALATWELVLPDATIAILSPWEQYWRSRVRFPTGTKPKDAAKLAAMHKKLLSVPDLAASQRDPLCNAYERFHNNMVTGSSNVAFMRELQGTQPDIARLVHIGALVLARTLLHVGQNNPATVKLVQGAPRLFNRCIGSQ